MKKVLFIGFTACLLFVACKKENESADTQAPVVSIATPTNNQSVTVGQAIPITANMSDNGKISEVHLEIINNTTGAFLTHEHYAPDAATYTLSRTFTPSAAGTYRIKVEAEDSNGNQSQVSVLISANWGFFI